MGFFCFDSFQRRGRVGCKGEKTFLPRWFPGQWGAGMKTVLYLDELLLVNFVAAALFLLCSGLVCGRSCTPVRLLAGAAWGALASLAMLMPRWPPLAALLYQGGTGAAAVALAYGWPGLRPFVRLLGWFLLCNLLLTGVLLLPWGAESHNMQLYLPVSPGVLLVLCAGVYLALRGALYCLGRAKPALFTADLELEGAVLPVQALYDTGFQVMDPLSGRTVVLLRYESVCGQLPAALSEWLADYFDRGTPPPPGLGVRLLPCHTVAGRGLLPAVPAQKLTRTVRGRTWQLPRPLAAFCPPGLPPEGWTLLLGEDAAVQLGL